MLVDVVFGFFDFLADSFDSCKLPNTMVVVLVEGNLSFLVDSPILVVKVEVAVALSCRFLLLLMLMMTRYPLLLVFDTHSVTMTVNCCWELRKTKKFELKIN